MEVAIMTVIVSRVILEIVALISVILSHYL